MNEGQNTNGIYSAPRPDFQSVRPVGDIVLTPGVEKKKSKLPLIIAGVMGVVILTIIIVLIIPKSDSSDVKTKFNEFANYFLYEKESDVDIEGMYNYGGLYWLADIKLTDDQVKSHFKKSKEKFDVFYQAYKKDEDKYGEDVRNIIEKYLERLEMFEYSRRVPMLSSSNILSAYVDDELEGDLSDMIKDYYADYNSAMTESVRNLGVNYNQKAENLIKSYEKYDADGCIDRESENLKNGCRESSELTEYVTLYKEYMTIHNNAQIEPYQNIWRIEEGLDV